MQFLTVLLRHEDKNVSVLHLQGSCLSMDGVMSYGN
jgi:hypothetical protein